MKRAARSSGPMKHEACAEGTPGNGRQREGLSGSVHSDARLVLEDTGDKISGNERETRGLHSLSVQIKTLSFSFTSLTQCIHLSHTLSTTQSLTQSLSHSPIHSLTHSPTHSHSLTHSHTLTHPINHTHSFTLSLTHSLNHTFILSLTL